jgi:hypothetical protein
MRTQPSVNLRTAPAAQPASEDKAVITMATSSDSSESDSSSSTRYIVDKILDDRVVRGVHQYLIKWHGCALICVRRLVCVERLSLSLCVCVCMRVRVGVFIRLSIYPHFLILTLLLPLH